MDKIKGYAYDLHVHTNQGSACGSSSGAEQALAYKKAGFAGIVITDHFFNGNCAVDGRLPWPEKVERFCMGYEDALQAGQMVDLDVFFGFEWNINGAEFLIYGLDPKWLLLHENLDHYSVGELFCTVSESGGAMIQAHPYREAWYIKQVMLYPGLVHGIEVINLGNESRDPHYNEKAIELAKKNHFRMTVGSDSHHVDMKKAGLVFPNRLYTSQALVEQILSKQDQTGKDWFVCDSDRSYFSI